MRQAPFRAAVPRWAVVSYICSDFCPHPGSRDAVMLYYLIIIGVFNLGLGYVLAVYLGYGPPSLSSALHAMNAFAEPRIGQPVMIDMLESLDPAIAECIVPTPE